MASDTKILGLSPIIMVSDIEQTKKFYANVLEFDLVIDNQKSRYAMLQRGPAMLAFIENRSDEAKTATSEHASAQLWVTGIDHIWSDLEPRLADWPDCTVKAPHDRDYGVREIHLKDPDGFLIFITQDQS